jgi:hypothetical protein
MVLLPLRLSPWLSQHQQDQSGQLAELRVNFKRCWTAPCCNGLEATLRVVLQRALFKLLITPL